jgi:penicillin-binding protein 1C
MDPACRKPVSHREETIRILGIEPNTLYRPAGVSNILPSLVLQAQGGQERLYWLLNGEMIGQSPAGVTQIYQFEHPGRYQLTVMYLAGNHDSVEFVVMGGRG